MDLLVSEDHTKTTSILHWIQVDSIICFIYFRNVILSFRARGKHLPIISQDSTLMMTWMQIPLCEAIEVKLAVSSLDFLIHRDVFIIYKDK